MEKEMPQPGLWTDPKTGMEYHVNFPGADKGFQLGGLFYDFDFGNLLSDWFYEDSTTTTRQACLAEVTMRVEEDPRVAVGSVKSRLLAWDDTGFSVAVSWRFIGEDQPLNLVLTLDKSVRELVIRDGRYTEPQAI